MIPPAKPGGLGLQPREQMALDVARRHVNRCQGAGPAVTKALVETISRLTESQPRYRRYWPTDKGWRFPL